MKLGKDLTKVKAPYKLRLSEELPSKNRSVVKSIGTVQFTKSEDTICKAVRSQIIFLLFKNKVMQKGYSNNVILNIQMLEMVFDKLINIFDSKQLMLISQQLPFLNNSMDKLKQMNILQMRQRKNKRFTINLQINAKFSTQQIHGKIRNFKDEIEQLQFDRFKLLKENQQIYDSSQKMGVTLMQKRMAVQQQIQKLSSVRRQLQDHQQQKINLQAKLGQLRSNQRRIQSEILRIINFVDNQNKNIHVRNASKKYLEIESDIYEYAVYLQANQAATSLQFQSIPLKNQIYVIERLESTIKGLNRDLVSNTEMSIEDKGRAMRDFVLELNSQYRRKDEEQQKTIEFKTRFIRKFVEKMKLWIDNWTLKQEFLVDLRKQFAALSLSLDQQFSSVFSMKLCHYCSIQTQNLRQKILLNYQRMRENYYLGNSFY